MAIAADSTAEQTPSPFPHEPSEEFRGSPDQPDHGEANEADFEEEEDGDAEELDGAAAYEERVRAVFRRLHAEPVGTRVHDIIIEGNLKTRAALIEAEVADLLRSAGTVQGLLLASMIANERLRGLDVFESVSIVLDAGPPELPGTTNVLIQVVEAGTFSGFNFGYFSRPEVKISNLLNNRLLLLIGLRELQSYIICATVGGLVFIGMQIYNTKALTSLFLQLVMYGLHMNADLQQKFSHFVVSLVGHVWFAYECRFTTKILSLCCFFSWSCIAK
jgi:outer membrane protein insertion porin family